MAFKGRDPVRTKIVIDKQLYFFYNFINYLGNMVSTAEVLRSIYDRNTKWIHKGMVIHRPNNFP